MVMTTNIPPFQRLFLPLGAYQAVEIKPMVEPHPQFEAPAFEMDWMGAMREPFKDEKCLQILDARSLRRLHALTTILTTPSMRAIQISLAFSDVAHFKLER